MPDPRLSSGRQTPNVGRPTGLGRTFDLERVPESTGASSIACAEGDAVRFLAAEIVENAGSGHPGTPMALAPLVYRLYTRWIATMLRNPDGTTAIE